MVRINEGRHERVQELLHSCVHALRKASLPPRKKPLAGRRLEQADQHLISFPSPPIPTRPVLGEPAQRPSGPGSMCVVDSGPPGGLRPKKSCFSVLSATRAACLRALAGPHPGRALLRRPKRRQHRHVSQASLALCLDCFNRIPDRWSCLAALDSCWASVGLLVGAGGRYCLPLNLA